MSKQIIAFCGFKGSGKDTAANYLVKNKGFYKFSFADSLKQSISVIFNWDIELINGVSPESRKWREEVDTWWSKELGIENFTPRFALQFIGTDLFRNHFNEDIWLLSLKNKLMKTGAKKIVISDCRFRNEIKMLNDLNAVIYEISRGTIPFYYSMAAFINNLSEEERKEYLKTSYYKELNKIHESEWSWIGGNIDKVINNNGSKEELYSLLDEKIN